MRVAAIEVSHWHSLYDAAYLRILSGIPGVELVGLHDPDAAVAAKRARELGAPPVFTDYREMLDKTKPDFVVALGRHSGMAETALYLLDRGVPFMMEKPMGLHAGEVSRIADKAAAQKAFVAVAFPQRYSPFVARARQMLAEGRFGTLSHLYFRLNRPTSARYPAWDSPWMLDPAQAGGGCLRNLGSHVLDLFLLLTGEEATVTGAQLSARALGQRVEDFASVLLRVHERRAGHGGDRQHRPLCGERQRVEDGRAGTPSSSMTTTTRCGSSQGTARRRYRRRPRRHCIRRRCVTSSTTGGAACLRR